MKSNIKQQAIINKVVNDVVQTRWHLSWIMTYLGVKANLENGYSYTDYKFRRTLIKRWRKRIGCVGADLIMRAIERYLKARCEMERLAKEYQKKRL